MKEPCVWYSVGRTISVGQFESVRVDVGESVKTEDGSFDDLRDRVDNRLNSVVKEITDQLKPKTGKKG